MKNIIFIILLCLTLRAQARIAYFGFAGTETGSGVFGHSFIILKEQKLPFLLADAYQYNITSLTGEAPSRREISAGLTIFKPTRHPFNSLYDLYTSDENRVIAIYELNLLPNEVADLEKRLQNDLNDPTFADKHKYGANNNCASRPIELINSVVDDSRKIEFKSAESIEIRKSLGFLSALQGALLNRLPFYLAATMEHHPVSKGRVQLYERRSTTMGRFLSSIQQQLDQIKSNCQWSSQTRTTAGLYVTLFLTDPEHHLIDPVVRLINHCPSGKPIFYNQIIPEIYSLLESKYKKSRDGLYDLMSHYQGGL